MSRSKNWLGHIADIQMTDFPGAKYEYKEFDVIILSAVIGKACGGTSWEYCNEHLYRPLEIASDPWGQSKCGVSFPSMYDVGGADLSARDMAKIGRLILHGGVWAGKQIISEDYIRVAVTPSEMNPTYGLLWWIGNGTYHCRGFSGQEINIHPDKNIVTVLQASISPSSKSYGEICENIVKQDSK